MDSDGLASNPSKAPRKVRFAPKGPPRRAAQKGGAVPKLEKVDDDDDDLDAAKAVELMQRYNEASSKAKSRFEKLKSGPTQVAFGYGGSISSSSLKSYKKVGGSSMTMSVGGTDGEAVQKEYREPWDYYTNYPVTLPLRRPYSGNPELLDEEEFREGSQMLANIKPAAAELGLMEENAEEKLLFIQLPTTMPMLKQETEGSDTAGGGSKPSRARRACSLNELSAGGRGFMGNMLVYKSGAVKLKLGEILYDVSPGMDCTFAQDVVTINTEEKQCSNIGEITKRVVITPNVDSILDSLSAI